MAPCSRPSVDAGQGDQATASDAGGRESACPTCSAHGIQWLPIPTKLLCFLATVIFRVRAASSNGPKTCPTVCCPKRNWVLASLRRHPELKNRRVEAVDWKKTRPQHHLRTRRKNGSSPLAESCNRQQSYRRMYTTWTKLVYCSVHLSR